jgi:hypothetical protein
MIEIHTRYRHNKSGNFYRVIALGRHSETGDDLVVYEAEYDKSIWIRPCSMWEELVVINGEMKPRFEKVS